MSARSVLIAALAEDRRGGIATRAGVTRAEQLVDAHEAEVLAAQSTVCGVCGGRLVRFADDRTGGGWMHDRGNDDASDDPAAGADHAAVPVAVPEEKATPAGATATPFFQPGHAYTHRDGHDFRCAAVTLHPVTGERLALGWRIRHGVHYLDAVGINQWNHEYDGVEPPTSNEDGTQ